MSLNVPGPEGATPGPVGIDRDELAGLVEGLTPACGLRIGGRRLRSEGREEFRVEDPTTAGLITVVADGTRSDATLAVTSAADAASGWATTPPRERAEMLRRAHGLMLAESRLLAGLISWENGKTLTDARTEVAYAAEFFRWFSEEAVRLEGGYGPAPSTATRTIVTHRPVGVAALVTPWNFPAAMVTRKLAPALAAGCTTVLKPAAETPLTALAVADVLERAGLPGGVINVVPSTRPAEVVDSWLTDARVRKLSFTGSTAVGRTLLAGAAGQILNSSMELGGNAPFIVAADAGVPAAVAGALVAKFRNAGQACTAANRFYVHETVAAEFTARFGAAIEALVVDDPFGHADLGPMISARAVDKLDQVVREAVRGGARISHRGLVPDGPGHFYPPTLLTDVAPGAPILREELFGPVAPLVTWSGTERLVGLVNDTEHGLASYVFSNDLRWALKLAERLEVGMVGINRGLVSDPSTPFGGVKQSGLGREGGREGIHDYLETQFFSVDWDGV